MPRLRRHAPERLIKENIDASQMMRPEGIAEGVRFVVRPSPSWIVPEIVFQRPGESFQ